MKFLKGPYLQNPSKGGITIRWQTDEAVCATLMLYDTFLPQVPKDPRRNNLDTHWPKRATGSPRIYHTDRGTFHRVEINDLSCATEYSYEIILTNKKETLRSGLSTFRTAPDDSAAFSFILMSEFGGTASYDCPTLPPLRELIRRERPDFIQSVGDIVSRGTDDSHWDLYLFSPFSDILRTTPFFPCVGNHETMHDATCVDPTLQAEMYRFYDRYLSFPHCYSYDYGCAHFTVMDSTAFFSGFRNDEKDAYVPILREDWHSCDEYRFLEHDLAESTAKWKFVIFHFPVYASSYYVVRDLRVLCPLFEKYGVDIVFNSHAILYERSHPIRGGKPHPNGVRYILTGGFNDVDWWFWERTAHHSAKIAARPNYVRVALTPWSLELQAVDYEGKLFDSLVLSK